MITLLNDACENAMKTLDDNSVDAIICDPPFGVTQCEWDNALDMNVIWPEYIRILKPNGVIVLFSSQPFTSKLILSNEKMFRYCWYWEKEQGTGFLNAKSQPLRVIEEVCIFTPAASTSTIYKPRLIPRNKVAKIPMPKTSSDIQGKFATQDQDERVYQTYTHRQPINLISFARDRNTIVPTQKPVALLEYMVETYTNEGDVVLDNTMGSGTCGVACKRLKRNFIGIEADKERFELAKERIEKTPEPFEFIEESKRLDDEFFR